MDSPDLNHVRSAHLIGIGGTAMTPLATILCEMGVRVSGSDLADGPSLDVLRDLGATVAISHHAENLPLDAEVVVVSSAIPEGNPEVCAARERHIPVIKHAAALGSLMRARRGVAIAGTHGKTTTSALTAVVLREAGIDATYHVGSELLNYGRFGQLGRSDLLVAEADEYDRRFLDYEPELALVTSVEPDHLDYFGTFDEVVAAFEAFLARIRPGGVAVLCTDDPVVRRLATGTTRRVTYGVAEDADWRLLDWYPAGADGSHFTVRAPSGAQHTFSFHLLGKHNALNATGVIAVAGEVGLSLDEIARGVEAFRGTRRRFEVVGTADGVSVVDDYAHHPTAIRVTLEAARAHYASAIWAVFQPHTAHRTQSLFHEFVRSFGAADHVYLVPTYRPAGREADEYDPTVAALAAALEHTDARSMSLDQAVAEIAEHAAPGDLVLVMGAGDVWRSEADLLDRLRSRSSS